MKKAAKTPENSLSGLLAGFKDTPVLVAGDIMLDRFVTGTVDRISPESPVPVLSITREDAMLGGAGNALANLAGLGAKGLMLSVLGDDAQGALVREKAKALGLDVSGLVSEGARPTIVKTRFLAGHQQLLRTDFESCAPVTAATENLLLNKAKEFLKTAKALVLSDYGKGLLQESFIAALIKMAKAQNVPVIVDPKGKDFSIYKGADVITPNRKELSEAVGMKVESDADVIAAAQKIINECGIGAVVATRSKDGISIIRKKEEPVHLRGYDIEVFDVSGAGDTVIAALAAALAAGGSLEDAAQLANIAGSIVVTKVGTAPIRFTELQNAVEGDDAVFAYANKKAPLSSWDEAAEQVKRWRAKGFEVGFTNGCFDILHAGHVSYLNAARGQCTKLIVGLNCDSSVKILKGPERPVHDEASRAAVLRALACVDMVVLFGAQKNGDDNTANELLKLLKPDVYFKGGDYKENEIPEAPIVKSFGGQIRLMPNFEGHSTTGSIKKIQAA